MSDYRNVMLIWAARLIRDIGNSLPDDEETQQVLARDARLWSEAASSSVTTARELERAGTERSENGEAKPRRVGVRKVNGSVNWALARGNNAR